MPYTATATGARRTGADCLQHLNRETAARSARRRLALLLLAAALAVVMAPSVARAELSVSKWEAGSCRESSCTDAGPLSAFYTQAAGHPEFGITDFEFNFKEALGAKVPEGKVKDVRVDLPQGLAVDPEATTEQCGEAQLEEFHCPVGSQVGVDEATGTAELLLGVRSTVEESFPVYNMQRKPGEPARFGVEINSSTLKAAEALLGHHLTGQLYLEGGISWHQEAETSESSHVATGDFHEYFKIQGIPQQPEVVESRLVFWGIPQNHTGIGSPTGFITLPSTCSSRPVTRLHVDSYESPGQFQSYEDETPVTATGCGSLQFNPSLTLSPETSQSDRPDGASVVLHVPQYNSEPSRPDSPDLKNTEVTLPEGMTLNPSAAHGLEGCTNEEIGLGTNRAIGCPAGSVIGSLSVNAPGIPDGSLHGSVYLGAPEPGQGPESGREYRIFLAAEAAQYGVGLRLEGHVVANLQTGRLTTSFDGTPQVPFEDFKLQFKGGASAPLANPLACGAAVPTASVTAYTGQPAKGAEAHGFVVDGNGAGAGCSSPLPFSLAQPIPAQAPAQAGAYSPFTFALTRADGEQYLSHISTTLPPGLLGAIPSVALCGELAANAGKCQATSQIGTVTVAVGSGAEPYVFNGHAYLTGSYGGSPYGLSIVVPAVAGPYDLGEVVTRAGINVDRYTARLILTSTLPTIVAGVPLRLRSLSVSVNRPSFTFNPTSCMQLATDSVLGSTMGASDILSSPFHVGGCERLAFKPSIGVATGARVSKKGGASLEVKVTQGAHEANIRQVLLQLPKQLAARLTTLQKACPAASFEAGIPPGTCSSEARVGSATVSTPVLPGVLTGPAYLVSHGGAAFPDLELILRGDGVEVVLVGHTHISSSDITTSNFEALPDVPISSVVVSLPIGPRSALAATRSACGAKLLAPTTIVAQNGMKVSRNTKIAVTGCPVTILAHKIRGGRAILTILVPQAGQVTVSGRYLRKATRRVAKAGVIKLSVALNGPGVAKARTHHGGLRVKLRVGFVAKAGHGRSAVSLAVSLR